MAKNWTSEEVAAIVSDYFKMLVKELTGKDYVKTEHRRQLKKVINRSSSAIERKHMNISAILIEKNLPYISGYKPYHHYQGLLKDEVEKHLQNHPELENIFSEFISSDVAYPEIKNILNTEVDIPDFDYRFYTNRTGYMRESNINYYEKEQRNSKLGLLGEKFVINYEQQKLKNVGRQNLTNKIEHISQTKGDAAGYDILSFDSQGRKKFIEVKTTRLGKNSPFYFTKNELGFSKENSNSYKLYRIFNFKDKPKFYQLDGALDKSCETISTEFMGWPK